MKVRVILGLGALTLVSQPALAADPTVTLTKAELAVLIRGAVAEQQAMPAMQAAQPVMEKVQKAFAPPPPPTQAPKKP